MRFPHTWTEDQMKKLDKKTLIKHILALQEFNDAVHTDIVVVRSALVRLGITGDYD